MPPRLDHGAIFVLIAGTNTPVYAVLFRNIRRWKCHSHVPSAQEAEGCPFVVPLALPGGLSDGKSDR